MKTNFGYPKWPLVAILKKKYKSCVLIWNVKKCKCKLFSDIQNGRRWPFWKKYESCVWIWNYEKDKWKWILVIQNVRRSPFWNLKKCFVFIWNDEKYSGIQNGSRGPCWKNMKVAFWSAMARKANKKELWISKMGAGNHLEKNRKFVFLL